MLLVCSAWDEENKYLTESLSKKDSMIKSLGIGYINAILSLQEIDLNLKTQGKKLEEIIFIGTCGYFPNGSDLMQEILEVDSTEILHLGTVQNNSYLLDNTAELIKSAKQPESVKVHCLSTLEISHNDKLADTINKYYREKNSLSDNDILVENLEVYGVAAFAKQRGIKWRAYLGTTNKVSQNGHQEWQENHVQVSKKR